MYTLVFDPIAIDSLNKLPSHIKKRIVDKLSYAQLDPFRFFHRLHGRSDYKLCIGQYRVIADLFMDSKTILITTVGHRRNVYKR